MTDPSTPSATSWDQESHGVEWHLELDRATLLPGRLVGGRVSLRASKAIEARGVAVALVAQEHWRHMVVRPNAKGGARSEVVTEWQELLRQPVVVHGAVSLTPGLAWDSPFEVPVPPLGPATLKGLDSGLDWTLEAKLDIDDAFDSRIEAPVVVAQPIALLRSGAVTLPQFALYETAEVIGEDVAASITLEPAPLVRGRPFTGRLELRLSKAIKVQEIRAELRADVAATVSNGVAGHVVLWSGVVASGGSFDGTVRFEIAGTVAGDPLPTMVLPHGKSGASFHVILARAFARDVHLVRDVAIATTDEL